MRESLSIYLSYSHTPKDNLLTQIEIGNVFQYETANGRGLYAVRDIVAGKMLIVINSIKNILVIGKVSFIYFNALDDLSRGKGCLMRDAHNLLLSITPFVTEQNSLGYLEGHTLKGESDKREQSKEDVLGYGNNVEV